MFSTFQHVFATLFVCIALAFPASVLAAPSDTPTTDAVTTETPPPLEQPIALFTAPEHIEVGKKVFLDASETKLVPTISARPIYRWDFGDGSPREVGRDVLHTYTKPGEYTVQLRVAQGETISSIEKKIFVFDRQAVLITDDETHARLTLIAQQAAENGVLLTIVSGGTGETGFVTEEQLLQKIQEQTDALTAASTLLFYTRTSVGLQAFTRYYQNLITANRFDLTTKLFLKIADDSLELATPITQQAFRIIQPRYILLTRAEALAPFFEERDTNKLIDVLASRGIEHRIIDARSERGQWLLLSRLVSSLVARGVPSNILYLLLAFPFAAAAVALFRQVVGGATFGVYAPAMLAVAFLILGAELGLIALAVVVAVSYLLRLVFARVELLYIPRVALLFSAIALSLFAVIWAMLALGSSVAMSLAIFPLLMMSTISEKILSAQAEEGATNALLATGQTIALAVVTYYALAWPTFSGLLLSFPELVFIPLVLTFIAGRFTGLKLTEYFRFRALLREPGTEE